MFFIAQITVTLTLSVILVAFIEGSTFVLLGIIAHEDYGTKRYSQILGIFMTAAAVGILVYDILVFDQFYSYFITQEQKESF